MTDPIQILEYQIKKMRDIISVDNNKPERWGRPLPTISVSDNSKVFKHRRSELRLHKNKRIKKKLCTLEFKNKVIYNIIT